MCETYRRNGRSDKEHYPNDTDADKFREVGLQRTPPNARQNGEETSEIVNVIKEISQTKEMGTHNHIENIIAKALVTINSTIIGSE